MIERRDLVDDYLHTRTFGFALAGIGAGIGNAVAKGSTMRVQAVAAGLGAFVGGLAGDTMHTKLSTADKIKTATLVGAVAVGTSLATDKLITTGTITLMDWSRKHGGVTKNILDGISRFRDGNPVFKKLVTRSSLKGVMLGLGIPMAHKYIQRMVADDSRKRETFFASIDRSLQDFNPNRANKQAVDPPHRPGILRLFGQNEI